MRPNRGAAPLRAFLILLAVLLGVAPPAVGAPAPGAPIPEVVGVLSSNLDGVVLELRAAAPVVALAGEPGYDRVTVPGFGLARVPGAPELPLHSFLIGVPPDADIEIHVLEATSEVLPGTHRVLPAATQGVEPPLPDLWASQVASGELPRTVDLVEDGAIYGAAAYYPAEIVRLVELGWIRHQRVAAIEFYPVQAKAEGEELRYTSRAVVELAFRGMGGPEAGFYGEAEEPESYEALLERSVVNYESAREWRDLSGAGGVSPSTGGEGSPDPGYRLRVQETGLYRLSYDYLAAAGLPVGPGGLDPRTFQIYSHGEELAIRVVGQGDGQFNPGDQVLFYGAALAGAYAKYGWDNVYWLTYDPASLVQGRRMAEVDGTPNGAAVPGSYWEELHFEQDADYWSLMPGGDDDFPRWYWDYAIAPGSMVQTAELPGVLPSPATATIRVSMYGYTNMPPNPDQHIVVWVNENWVGEFEWDGVTGYVAEIDFDQDYLQEGANTIRFEALLNPGVTYSSPTLDWFEIGYRRAYAAVGDQLEYALDGAGTWEVRVAGFTTPDVAGSTFDVTDPLSVARVVNGVAEPFGGGYRLRFGRQIAEPRAFWSGLPAEYRVPEGIEADTPSDLHSPGNGADYLMIAHPDFVAAVQPLADYYAAGGLRVEVLDVQDVYDEFGGGLLYPGAIRDFLAYAYAEWQPPAPEYVLLVGDGHFDYKEIYPNTDQGQYLPPYMAYVDPYIGETATDNRYVSLAGEDAWPEMKIGRFPVRTVGEAGVLVTKSLSYQASPAPGDWTEKLLFTTDNPDAAGNFYALSDAIIAGYVPEPYGVDRVYYGQAPYTTPGAVKTAILAAINEGRLLVSYIGHAAIGWWAQEQLLKTTDVPGLNNGAKWPVMLPMTCQEGRFDQPWSTVPSLSEMLVRVADKGAVASWAPTGWGVATGHDLLEKGFLESIMYFGVRRLGDATLEGKRFLWENGGGGFRDLLETYALLGDPYLALPTQGTDVGLTKTVEPVEPLQPTDPITYTLSLVNEGPALAFHVVVTDLMPAFVAGAEVVFTTLDLVQRPGVPFVWDVQDLLPGQAGSIVIRGTVDGSAGVGMFLNEGRVATTSWERGTLPNDSSVWSQVVAGPPALIEAAGSPDQIPVGGHLSAVEAWVTDLWGNPVADGTPVAFSTDLGSVNPATGSTLDGLAYTILTSGPEAGIATVTATSGEAQGTAQVQFVPGSPAAVGVAADPQQIQVGGATSDVSALVTDSFGNPVADGTTVEFATSRGSISPTSAPTLNGVATTTLTSGSEAGVALVSAQAGDAAGTVNVTFIPGPPAAITLVSTPPTVPVGGQSSLLATVTDAWGNAVADGTPVDFATTLGAVSPPTKPTMNGQATVTFLAGTAAGQATITATSGGASGQVLVPVLAGAPAALDLVAFPTSIPLLGTAVLTAAVTDEFDNPVQDGTEVLFNTTLGSVDPSVATTEDGVAVSTLLAGDEPGVATVTAEADGASDSVPVTIGEGAPVAIALTADPPIIVAGAQTSQIAALVTDLFGQPITQTIPITFETTLGQVVPEVTWVVDGWAYAEFSSTESGLAQVTAETSGASAATVVTVLPGAPAALVLTIDPPQVPLGGQATLLVAVADLFGNPVANGTLVTFTTSLGSADPVVVATNTGWAESTFHAGTVAGTGLVTATSGLAWDEALVTVLPGPAAVISLTAEPPIILANGEDQSQITAMVYDLHGNPVVDGTAVAFSTTRGSVDPPLAYTIGGQALTTLTAGTKAGVATVIGQSDAATATVQVTLQPGPVANLELSATPGEIPADGQSQSALLATATDAFANPVFDGTEVTFQTSLGTVWPERVPTSGGHAQAALTAGTVAGTALVTATAEGVSNTVQVRFRPGAPAHIWAEADPYILVADGTSTSEVTATVSDQYGNPAQDGTQVQFSTTLGTVISPTVQTVGGVASTLLQAGTALGLAQITATSGTAPPAHVEVALIAGPPFALNLIPDPESIPADGVSQSTIHALVRDAWDHPVADGTGVSFTTDHGTLAPESAQTVAGWAQTVLTAGTEVAIATVTATSGSASGTVQVPFTGSTLKRIYLPLILHNPNP